MRLNQRCDRQWREVKGTPGLLELQVSEGQPESEGKTIIEQGAMAAAGQFADT